MVSHRVACTRAKRPCTRTVAYRCEVHVTLDELTKTEKKKENKDRTYDIILVFMVVVVHFHFGMWIPLRGFFTVLPEMLTRLDKQD